MQFDRLITGKIFLSNTTYTGYIGDIEFANLRVSFSIVKTFSWSTNTAAVRIYNLSPSKRNKLKDFGDQLRLFAGYRSSGNAQLIFTGNVTQLNHSFDQPEVMTILNCGDGERSLNNTLVAVSFGEKTPARTVIQYIADKLNFPIVDFAGTENLLYDNGFNDADLAKNVLDKACKKLDLQWSVQNENLIIIKNNGSTDKPPVDINAETGMIGVPERYVDKSYFLYRAITPNQAPKPGWRVRMLLRPDLIPGDRVRIRSKQLDFEGEFLILTVRHEGDNYGQQFETTIEAIPT